ncbi:hypothetical protein QYM36_003846 [Artemia franciscana]|uniref:Ig-like domain-containing protein n=1 Tax=Artemia franciscana TaxID=6661 RepID=A0AA88L956_ARTSF|nr:hypothetical protein QYM36_003846 [Artemia franciscana]
MSLVISRTIFLFSYGGDYLMNILEFSVDGINYSVHFILVRPIEVKIDDTTKHLSAGVEANLVCRAYGARPPPLFTWWMDNVLKEELGVVIEL